VGPHTFAEQTKLIGDAHTKFPERRLMVLVRLPKIQPKGQTASARRRRTFSSRCASLRPHGDCSLMATHRLLLESLPVSPSVSRLRAEGKITADMTSVWIGFGAIELKREVGLEHRRFPNGGYWSFFLCPRCDRRVRRLRLHDGRPMCSYCCGNSTAFPMGHQSSVGRRANSGSRNCKG
jgi:hypothetical protein